VAQIPVEKLVFLDECGFSLNLHRLYGWILGGGRCEEAVPFNKGMNRSVLGAFSLPTQDCPTGMRALWQKLGAWTRDTFEAFLQEGLLPRLPKGSVLVLDNARIHHGGNIEACVKRAGCSLLYLPPYSPDFNPIELAWGWIKARVRTLAPRNDIARERDIQAASQELPTSAPRNWFKHCMLLTH
jgi:transposase